MVLYDKDIREPLFYFLEERYGKVRILEEKRIGSSRADVVLIKERSLCGIEIKSDADSYARLGGQIRDYDLYYDYNYVVVGTSHALHIREHVPDWWGIITVELVENQVDFYVLREAEPNPQVDWKRKMSILWRPELAHIQERNGLPKYARLSKAAVVEKILQKMEPESLYGEISEELFQRDYNVIEETIQQYRESTGRKTRKRRRRPVR